MRIFDIIAVRSKGDPTVRILDAAEIRKNADAIETDAANRKARTGPAVRHELFVVVPLGTYKDGDTYRGEDDEPCPSVRRLDHGHGHGHGRKDSEKISDVLATPFLTSGQVGRQVESQLSDFSRREQSRVIDAVKTVIGQIDDFWVAQ